MIRSRVDGQKDLERTAILDISLFATLLDRCDGNLTPIGGKEEGSRCALGFLQTILTLLARQLDHCNQHMSISSLYGVSEVHDAEVNYQRPLWVILKITAPRNRVRHGPLKLS